MCLHKKFTKSGIDLPTMKVVVLDMFGTTELPVSDPVHTSVVGCWFGGTLETQVSLLLLLEAIMALLTHYLSYHHSPSRSELSLTTAFVS